jgi:hypothetical protein
MTIDHGFLVPFWACVLLTTLVPEEGHHAKLRSTDNRRRSLLSKLAGDGAFGQANSLILLSRP